MPTIALKIGYKTFARLTDLAADSVSFPCEASDQALSDLQDTIGWPWSATQQQLGEWSDSWRHWAGDLSEAVTAQKAAGVWPIHTRAGAVDFVATLRDAAPDAGARR